MTSCFHLLPPEACVSPGTSLWCSLLPYARFFRTDDDTGGAGGMLLRTTITRKVTRAPLCFPPCPVLFFITTAFSSQRQVEEGRPTQVLSPVLSSQYMGVNWNGKNKRWIAEVRHKKQRLMHRAFSDEEEAAHAIDRVLRQHFGETILTNFHHPSGVFLDPKHAFVTKVSTGSSSSCSDNTFTSTATWAVTYVEGLRLYKAVIKLRGRPHLIGLFSSRDQAIAVIKKKTQPREKGGMSKSPKQSRFLGVSWDCHHKKWTARLYHGGTRVLSQTFKEDQEEEAALVYDMYARRYHGDGAFVNFDMNGNFLDPKNRSTRIDASAGVDKDSQNMDFRGVSWSKETNKWYAQIRVAGLTFNLGYFSDIKAAALQYDMAARKYHGTYARCNFDLQGNRTEVRMKLNNSAAAKVKYTVRENSDKEDENS